MGRDLVNYKNCKFRFGSHAKSHDENKTTTSTEEQTMSRIWLGQIENFQGRYKIFFLRTGRVVTRKHKIREITIPNWFIRRIETLAACGGQDLEIKSETLFADRFDNETDFFAALCEGGIAGVMRDDDYDDENNYAGVRGNDETFKPDPGTNTPNTKTIVVSNLKDQYDHPGIYLEGVAEGYPPEVRNKIAGVPPP